MNNNLISLIICPICKNEMISKILKKNNDIIEKGYFYCRECDKVYPIENEIINFI